MKKIRVGLVGCGRISRSHFDVFQKLVDDYELISICDNDPSALLKAEKETGARSYPSIEEMLDKEKLDLVSLCTPSGLHAPQGTVVAQHGIHVLLEKPMATNISDANVLIKACHDHQVNCFVVKQNRLNPTIKLLQKAIENKRFGRIYFAEVNVFWTRPQSYYDAASWRGTWTMDGGAYLNQASHYVDLLQWLVGEPESVCAITATMERKIEAEDTGAAIVKFRNGAIGSINVTVLTYPKNLEGSITIIGEKGTVKIGGIAVNEIKHWEFDSYDDDDKKVETASYKLESVYGYGHLGFYKNVADTLLRNSTPLTTGEEGRKSLELIEALYISSKEKRFVSLPLK